MLPNLSTLRLGTTPIDTTAEEQRQQRINEQRARGDAARDEKVAQRRVAIQPQEPFFVMLHPNQDAAKDVYNRSSPTLPTRLQLIAKLEKFKQKCYFGEKFRKLIVGETKLSVGLLIHPISGDILAGVKLNSSEMRGLLAPEVYVDRFIEFYRREMEDNGKAFIDLVGTSTDVSEWKIVWDKLHLAHLTFYIALVCSTKDYHGAGTRLIDGLTRWITATYMQPTADALFSYYRQNPHPYTAERAVEIVRSLTWYYLQSLPKAEAFWGPRMEFVKYYWQIPYYFRWVQPYVDGVRVMPKPVTPLEPEDGYDEEEDDYDRDNWEEIVRYDSDGAIRSKSYYARSTITLQEKHVFEGPKGEEYVTEMQYYESDGRLYFDEQYKGQPPGEMPIHLLDHPPRHRVTSHEYDNDGNVQTKWYDDRGEIYLAEHYEGTTPETRRKVRVDVYNANGKLMSKQYLAIHEGEEYTALLETYDQFGRMVKRQGWVPEPDGSFKHLDNMLIL